MSKVRGSIEHNNRPQRITSLEKGVGAVQFFVLGMHVCMDGFDAKLLVPSEAMHRSTVGSILRCTHIVAFPHRLPSSCAQ